MSYLRTLLFSLAFLALASTARADAALTEKQWQVDGVARRALIAIPKAATQPAPLVFVFHGHGGSPEQAARSIGLHRQWPEAIVVYMAGLPTPGALTDPQGARAGWQKAPGDQGDRDLKFFDAVLKSVRDENKVDEKRIYGTGHSNGGAFTYLLWAERGDAFAAVAPCAAVYRRFTDLKPKPALHLAGQSDPLVQYAMQQRMMTAVRALDGCAADGKPWAGAGNLVGTIYSSDKGTPFVSLISPAGHEYPAAATELVVRFFKEHPKP